VNLGNPVNTVHLVVPAGIDDPALPSGGNSYDRRVSRGLTAIEWSVHEHPVPGSWPHPEPASQAALETVITGLPDGAVVLLDGLIASMAADVLVPQAGRLRLVVLVHMPLGARQTADAVIGSERAVLSAAAAVITTSSWTRHWLLSRYALPRSVIHVAEPGAEPAPPAPGTASGGQLICVAAVTANKGHDVLLAALATVPELPWRCLCVGSLERDPEFVGRLESQLGSTGLAGRVSFVGPRTGADLAQTYAAADLLLLASHHETYGMVVTEALARGLPVIATDVGGVPEAMGYGANGVRPGLLVRPADPEAFAAALRCWYGRPDVRDRMRTAAGQRRATLPGWSATATAISRVLAGVSQ
jgi:glycosyltransferase involved in cell wall biosynthesis